MTNNSQAHEFAIFVPDLTNSHPHITSGNQIVLAMPELYHRLVRVLRLQPGKMVVLFDRTHHVRCEVETIEKDPRLTVRIHEMLSHTALEPQITVWLPLLKKDDLDTALYALHEMGVTDIQLITTQKTQRSWTGNKEMERLERIMGAAAEQSKQFVFPALHEPQPLTQLLSNTTADGIRLFADPTGADLWTVLKDCRDESPTSFTLLVGPEGDLTHQEKEHVKTAGFISCALTPTVLRAHQAVSLLAGIIRSVFK